MASNTILASYTMSPASNNLVCKLEHTGCTAMYLFTELAVNVNFQ